MLQKLPLFCVPLFTAVFSFFATNAWAQEAKLDSGDTAWIIVATALVFAMMLPGLAFFYGGLVRSKNVLGTVIQTAVIVCVVSLVWAFWGYSLAFGPDKGGGLIGGLDYAMLTGVEGLSGTIPHQLFMVFQLMFCAITVALIAGAFAERMKFTALLLFAVLWATLIYAPLAHWVWGGGWLSTLKGGAAMDFAGGAVVHISSGFAALACALAIGKRKGYGTDNMAPHNLPFVLLGAAMLWFGWFGFNAGSALAANGDAAAAFVNTHLAASAGAIAWMVAEWMHRGKPTLLGTASGMIAGLATITPAAGFAGVGPMAAVIIGLIAGVVCYMGVVLKLKLGYDESLDVLAIHGFGGITGLLAVGFLAEGAVMSSQLIMIVATVAFWII